MYVNNHLKNHAPGWARDLASKEKAQPGTAVRRKVPTSPANPEANSHSPAGNGTLLGGVAVGGALRNSWLAFSGFGVQTLMNFV